MTLWKVTSWYGPDTETSYQQEWFRLKRDAGRVFKQRTEEFWGDPEMCSYRDGWAPTLEHVDIKVSADGVLAFAHKQASGMCLV